MPLSHEKVYAQVFKPLWLNQIVECIQNGTWSSHDENYSQVFFSQSTIYDQINFQMGIPSRRHLKKIGVVHR